jgi:hypothetical protein
MAGRRTDVRTPNYSAGGLEDDRLGDVKDVARVRGRKAAGQLRRDGSIDESAGKRGGGPRRIDPEVDTARTTDVLGALAIKSIADTRLLTRTGLEGGPQESEEGQTEHERAYPTTHRRQCS